MINLKFSDKKSYDVIVVGGGIIGCSVAYYLAKEKIKVLVLEKDTVGSHASSGAAGMLGIHSEHFINPSFRKACLQSRTLYASLSPVFKEQYGIDIEYEQSGIMMLACSEKEKKDFVRRYALDHEVQWHEPVQVKTMMPALKGDIKGGVFCPLDGQVSVGRVCASFYQGALAHGAEIKEHAEVTGFIRHKNRVTGVQAKNAQYQCAHIVLAAGPWTGLLSEKLGLHIPIQPVRGQILIFQMQKRFVTFPVFLGESGFYMVPKPDGYLYAGTTMEHVGFREKSTQKAIQKISKGVMTWFPGIGDLPFKGAWAGLRPGTPDGLPVIGPAKGIKGLWLAAGHFRRGILLAPYTGQQIARHLFGGKPHSDQ